MKLILFIVLGIVILFFLYLIGLSVASRQTPGLGLLNNQLRPCPATPNCVNSEQTDSDAYIKPFAYSGSADEAWRRLKQVIMLAGGEILIEQDGYLHARFITPIMRYRDDVECRIDRTSNVIHIRSASRVGRSDLGTNHKRVERLRSAFAQLK